MTAFIIIPIIVLIFVTPIKFSLRGIFNSIRNYSVTNMSIFGLLAVKFRLKVEDNKLFYSINNKNIKELSRRIIKRRTPNLDYSKAIKMISIDFVDIDIKYGVQDNAMRTALESASIYNLLMMSSKFVKISNFNVNVVTDYESDIFAIDIDIRTRFAILELLLIVLRIIFKGRTNYGKYREHNASNTA